jgi:tripartite ATP-independent transporter DctM subunit
MEWSQTLLIIFGGVTLLLATGMPVAFCFLLANLLGVLILQGGGKAFYQLILSMYSSVSSFTLLPIPLFVLMGEILWHSGLALKAIEALDKMLGRLPGRLSILTVAAGTVFSTLSGSTMANTAMLGTMLLPDMERRGYAKSMSIGPIVASGGLAMMIPPSALAVILAALAKLSVGRILVGAIIPGFIMAALYLSYIIIRCLLQPELTPRYEAKHVPLSEKLRDFFKYLAPLSFIVFLVTGLIVFGVATPTEAAALGGLGSCVLAAAYRKLSWPIMKPALLGTINISVMTLTILGAAIGFSQILAYSGASRGLLEFVVKLEVPPLLLIVMIQLVILALGTFMEQIAIMLITLPILIPIVKTLGFDPIWFGVMMLINLEMAMTTPPFGLLLFVMKGVSSKETTMRDIYFAGLPFLICDAIAMAVVLIFPVTVTWFSYLR